MVDKVQCARVARQILPLILACQLLFACDSMPSFSSARTSLTEKPLNPGDNQGTIDATFSAALTPLEDMGLRKRKIPDMLKMLADNPYIPPEHITCPDIKQEMADLTVLLGPDVDTPKAALNAQQQVMEDGGSMLQDAVTGFVRSQTSIIPLRSIVRRLTGAAKNEKAVNNAIESGRLRRAYLRGLATAKFDNACIPHATIISVDAKPVIPATEAAKNDTAPVEIAKK